MVSVKTHNLKLPVRIRFSLLIYHTMKKLILIAILATLSMSGCKPLKETTYVDRWHETTKTDSVYLSVKDTMFLQHKGDTVVVNRIKTRIDYRYKYLAKIDTFTRVSLQDRIIEKKVNVPTTRWWGYIDIGLLLIITIYLFYRVAKLV